MTEGEAPAGDVPPPSAPPSWFGRRLLGVLVCAVAAALAIVGSFLPLVYIELSLAGRTAITTTISGWTVTANAVSGLRVPGVAQNGYPLAVAGAFLIIAAIFALVAALQAAPAGARSLAVLSGAIGAAFLAGTVATIAVYANSVISTVQLSGDPGLGVRAGLGAGFWLEFAAVLLAIGAVVLAALPVRGPAPDEYIAPEPGP
ncbi:hypothetical protein [Amycolatopsis sp. GM8]|uniref:hypothetical protein n=1 Tax=Amycolatopsis sp. GM8 TaxID=2896530 RepID=UPI001F1AEE36|nr:hypothetical protein [Amycolatopsis sp. GM8]